jgi:hypothetical protein
MDPDQGFEEIGIRQVTRSGIELAHGQGVAFP